MLLLPIKDNTFSSKFLINQPSGPISIWFKHNSFLKIMRQNYLFCHRRANFKYDWCQIATLHPLTSFIWFWKSISPISFVLCLQIIYLLIIYRSLIANKWHCHKEYFRAKGSIAKKTMMESGKLRIWGFKKRKQFVKNSKKGQ